MTTVTPYEITFKHEILNEFIASINGLIGRKFSQKVMPNDILKAKNEIWEIYRKLPFEKDLSTLNSIELRLFEIRDFILKRTNESKQCERGYR